MFAATSKRIIVSLCISMRCARSKCFKKCDEILYTILSNWLICSLLLICFLSVCVRACVCASHSHLRTNLGITYQLTRDGLCNWGKNWFPQCVWAFTWSVHAHRHTHKTQTGLWLATRDASVSSISLKIEWFCGAAKRECEIDLVELIKAQTWSLPK